MPRWQGWKSMSDQVRSGMLLMVTLWSLLLSAPSWADSAEQLFARYEPALLQVRVIEKASAAKSAIGTGFVLDTGKGAERLLVTNYHVVSEAVLNPDKYQLEALNQAQQKVAVTVLAVDVINDLALLASADPALVAGISFQLAGQKPAQGATIYSLGNPHDLGMILVPGTYNGLQKYSYYPRIHFTGSINSGMSGGPTVNADGQVVGVNVASGGNQLSFLVPGDALAALLVRYNQQGKTADFQQDMQQQLQQSQQRMMDKILAADWQLKEFGNGKVPDEVTSFIRCWGDSNVEKTHDKIKKVMAFCSQDDLIYLSEHFSTGPVQMQFIWLKAREMEPLQFFRQYQDEVSNVRPDNQANKEDVTPFECQQQVVTQHDKPAKVVYCVRAYKQFVDLYDVVYLASSMDAGLEGLSSHYTLSGVSAKQAQLFRRKFSEAVSWR